MLPQGSGRLFWKHPFQRKRFREAGSGRRKPRKRDRGATTPPSSATPKRRSPLRPGECGRAGSLATLPLRRGPEGSPAPRPTVATFPRPQRRSKAVSERKWFWSRRGGPRRRVNAAWTLAKNSAAPRPPQRGAQGRRKTRAEGDEFAHSSGPTSPAGSRDRARAPFATAHSSSIIVKLSRARSAVSGPATSLTFTTPASP